MTDRSDRLRQRQAAIAPQARKATERARAEAMGGGGGGAGIKYVVLRTWTASTMTAQELAYTDPSDPVQGEIEAVGEAFDVYPPPGFGYAAFEKLVYATDNETTNPLGRRVWPLRAYQIGGLWLVEPSFKGQPGLTFIDDTAEISAGSGG